MPRRGRDGPDRIGGLLVLPEVAVRRFAWIGVLGALEIVLLGVATRTYVESRAVARMMREGDPEGLRRVIERFPRYRALALYNLGNRFLRVGLERGDPAALQEALSLYRSALRVDPTWMPPKKNYEIAFRRLQPALPSEERGPVMEFRRVLPSIRPLEPLDIDSRTGGRVRTHEGHTLRAQAGP